MPTFEQLLLGAPLGFVNACLALNQLVAESGEEDQTLVSAVTETWYHVLKKTELSTQSLYNEKKAIIYIIRSMKTAQPAPSIAVAANLLMTKSFLSQAAVEQILLRVKELSTTEDADIVSVMKTHGKLKNFQWRIAVAVSSSSCKSLFTPCVSVRYDVIEEDGSATPYTAEMSYEQFKDFKAAFEKVSKVMDFV